MDQEISSGLAGFANALNSYLQMGQQRNMERQARREDYLWTKSVDLAMKEPKRTIPFSVLKKANKGFEALQLPDDYQVPVSELSEFSHVLPKEDKDESSFLTPQETASHLYMMNVPENEIANILSDFNKRGVKRISKSLLDETAKARGANPGAFEQRLRIFAGSVDPTDPDFMTKFKDWNTKIDSYTHPKAANDSAKAQLNPNAIDSVSQQASQVYEQYMKDGMSASDALNKTTDQLAEIYDGKSVSQIINKLDHTHNPRPATPMPGFKDLAKKLLGGGK